MQVSSVQVITQFTEDDQIKLPRRPLLRQAGLHNPGMGHGCQPLARQFDRLGRCVTTHQRVAAFGKVGTEFAIGAAGFEYRPVALAGQGGERQGALASFVPALFERPRVVVVAK